MLLPCTCILSRCRLGVYGVARSSDRHVARRHPSAELARILTDSRYRIRSLLQGRSLSGPRARHPAHPPFIFAFVSFQHSTDSRRRWGAPGPAVAPESGVVWRSLHAGRANVASSSTFLLTYQTRKLPRSLPKRKLDARPRLQRFLLLPQPNLDLRLVVRGRVGEVARVGEVL